MKKNTNLAGQLYAGGQLEQSNNTYSDDEKNTNSTEYMSQTTPKRTRNEKLPEAPKKTIDRDVIALEHTMRSLWTGPPESKRRLDLEPFAEDEDNKNEETAINAIKEMGV